MIKCCNNYQSCLYNCLVTAAGGEGGAEEQSTAGEDANANNSNSNVADKSSKPASASSKTQQHVDDADQSATGPYLAIMFIAIRSRIIKKKKTCSYRFVQKRARQT